MFSLRVKRLLYLGMLLSLLSGCSFGKHESTLTPLLPGADISVPAEATDFTDDDCPFKAPPEILAQRLPEMQCATLTVHEDWRKREETKIELAVAIVKTKSAARKPDPILVLLGGAGVTLENSYAMPFIFQNIASEHDFILVDQRGTGYSQPSFNCPELTNIRYNGVSEASLIEVTDQLVNASETCASTLQTSGVNLHNYATASMAAEWKRSGWRWGSPNGTSSRHLMDHVWPWK